MAPGVILRRAQKPLRHRNDKNDPREGKFCWGAIVGGARVGRASELGHWIRPMDRICYGVWGC